METAHLKMAYHCPVKTSALKNTFDGKFCNQCSKHIPDMRNNSTNAIIEEIKKYDGEFCGTFDPLQLQNPFGDGRDKIVNWYQRFSVKQKLNKKILVFISFFVLLVTGCRSRGIPGYSINGVPMLRVHPRSIIEYTESSNFVKHNVYKIHLNVKKEKKVTYRKHRGK